MLLYKILKISSNRLKGEVIVVYNKPDRALDIIFDLLVLY